MADTTVYGLTAEGFVAKILTVIRADFEARLKAIFNNNSLQLGDKSAFGQIMGIVSESFTLLWELAEAVNSSQDPDAAANAALDAICLLTGTLRPQARASAVTLTLFGTPATVVPAGSASQTTVTKQNFATSTDATIAAVPAWAAATVYAAGARVWSDTERIYQCIVAGTSGSVAVTGTGSAIVDNTAQWMMIADHIADHGAVDASAVCTVTGPIGAGANDINTIVNSVVGWDAVTNLASATPGRNIAADEELRIIRVQELSSSGGGTSPAILAKLIAQTYLDSATVFANNTDVVNSDSMPPHSVEVLVRMPVSAALDALVGGLIFASCVVAGIATTGNTSVTVTDSQSIDHVVQFSRPTEIPIYIAISVTKDATKYPADGDTQVAAAIETWGNVRANGLDAVSSAILAQAFSIPGVLDITVCNIGTAPSPTTNTTIAISLRQIATYSAAHIVVTSTNGTP